MQAGGLQDVLGAHDIDIIRQARLHERAVYVYLGRQVEDGLHVLYRLLHEFVITYITFDKLEVGAVFQVAYVGRAAACEVVEADDVMAFHNVFFRKMAADKACPAGD